MASLVNLQPLSSSKRHVQEHIPLHIPLHHPTARVSLLSRKNRVGKLILVHASSVCAPPPQQTLYEVLELSPDVGLPDIKKAYRQLARRYHPDVCPPSRSEESTRRFIEIQEAYETLSDPRRRAVYDHAVAMGRGSAVNGRMPWSPRDMDGIHNDWRLQWENQLFELRRQSSIKAQRRDSWATRVRSQHAP